MVLLLVQTKEWVRNSKSAGWVYKYRPGYVPKILARICTQDLQPLGHRVLQDWNFPKNIKFAGPILATWVQADLDKPKFQLVYGLGPRLYIYTTLSSIILFFSSPWRWRSLVFDSFWKHLRRLFTKRKTFFSPIGILCVSVSNFLFWRPFIRKLGWIMVQWKL